MTIKKETIEVYVAGLAGFRVEDFEARILEFLDESSLGSFRHKGSLKDIENFEDLKEILNFADYNEKVDLVKVKIEVFFEKVGDVEKQDRICFFPPKTEPRLKKPALGKKVSQKKGLAQREKK